MRHRHGLAVSLLLAALLSLAAAAPAAARQVQVYLKSGDMYAGKLLGIEDGTLKLKVDSGAVVDLPVPRIKEVWDADHKPVPLKDGAAAEAADEAPATVKRAPARSLPVKAGLGNQDVVKMVAAGLDPEVIIQSVQSNPGDFDTSVEGLVALKKAGVPSSVTKAMIAANAGGAPAAGAAVSADTAVYMVAAGARSRMRYSQTGMTYSSRLISGRGFTTLKEGKAELRTSDPSPSFEIALAGDANPASAVLILKLKAKARERMVQTMAAGMSGANTDIPKSVIVPVELEALRNQGANVVYRIVPKKPLPPGEYVVRREMGGERAMMGFGSDPARYYDFGVDGPGQD